MTNNELRELFSHHEKRQADFINWASKHEVVVSRSTVSRHCSDGNKIPGSYQLAYKWFFSFHGA